MAPGEENERWEAKGGQIVRLGVGNGCPPEYTLTPAPGQAGGWALGSWPGSLATLLHVTCLLCVNNLLFY